MLDICVRAYNVPITMMMPVAAVTLNARQNWVKFTYLLKHFFVKGIF